MPKQERSTLDETQHAPVQSGSVQNTPKRKSKGWLWVVLTCCGCLLCLVVIFGAALLMVGWGGVKAYKALKTHVEENNLLCRVYSDRDLREAYSELMTQDYQDKTAFIDYKVLYYENEEFFSDCDSLLPTFGDAVKYGFETSSHTTSDGEVITAKYMRKTLDGELLEITALVTNSEEIKLDELKLAD